MRDAVSSEMPTAIVHDDRPRQNLIAWQVPQPDPVGAAR